MPAVSTSTLYLVLRARDEASRVIRGLSGSLAAADAEAAKIQANAIRRGQSFATIGIAMAGAGLVGVASLNHMADAAMAYNQQATLTQTQTDKVSVSLQQIEQMGLRVGKTLPVAFDKIQPTLYDIFSSIDVNAPQAEKLLMNIGKAAVAGSADMQTVGRATIAILNAYKMPIKDVTKVNDVMFQLVRKGVGTYQEFTDVIGRVVPAGTKAGQTIQTIAGMMAFLTRNGISAQNAVAPVTQALNGLSKPAVVKTLKDMGVQVIDSTGKFRPLVDIVKDLKAKLDPLPNAIQALDLTKILKGGGNAQAAMKFWVTALKDTNALLPQMVDSMNHAGGASDAAYKLMSNTPAAKIQDMKNQFKALEIQIGNVVLPIKKDLAIAFGTIFSIFAGMNPALLRTIVIIGGIASILAILVGALTAAGGAMIILKTASGILGIAMEGTMTGSIIAATKTLRVSAAEWVLDTTIAVGAMIRQFVAMSLAAISNMATVAAQWLIVQIRAYAAAFGTETSVGIQIASWVALKIAAVANATEIAGAWALAGRGGGLVAGSMGLIGAAAVALTYALSNLDSQVTHQHKSWMTALKDFATGKLLIDAWKNAFNSIPDTATKGVSMGRALGTHIGDNYDASGNLTQAATDAAKMEKMINDLLNPKKIKKGPASANSSIVNPITAHITLLKELLKSGATEIEKMAKDAPSAANAVQKMMDALSKMTPNQLKALGVAGIEKLIDGLKSKEDALKKAYDDVLYKSMLAAQEKTKVLADKGAVAINAFIGKMAGDLGKDVKGTQIAFTLGSDVVAAYAEGMAKSDPKARLAAHNALVKSVDEAYKDVLDSLAAIRDGIVKKMSEIHDAVSKAIMEVGDFATTYKSAMDVAKVASEALADKNKIALDKVNADYKTALSQLDNTLKGAENTLSTSAKDIRDGINNAMNFSQAETEANKFENTFMDQLKIQAKKAVDFGAQIKTLIAMGLTGDSVSEIAKAGVDVGATIAKNLIDGGAQAITDTNAMVKSVNDLANSLADTTSKQFYQAGVDQAKAAVDGYISQFGPDSPGYQKMVDDGNAAVKLMANTMGTTFGDALSAQANKATKFADQIKQLIALGLSQEGLVQVIAAGSDTGGAIADSIIKGGIDGVKKINDLTKAIATMASSVGDTAATTFYGKGLASANAMIAAFTDNFGPKGAGRTALMSAMDDLANSMNRTATITITTLNPGLLGGGTGGTGTGSGNALVPPPPSTPKDPYNLPGLVNTISPEDKATAAKKGAININIPTTSVVTQDPQAYAAALGFYLKGHLVQ